VRNCSAPDGINPGITTDTRNLAMARPTSTEYHTDLDELLASVPQAGSGTSFGPDIDDANQVLLNPDIADDTKIERLRRWASRFQPCMFGRLGAKGLRGIRYDICWINRAALGRGSAYVRQLIQQARREWKERAAEGYSHGFLIMFNAPELSYARPGARFVELCLALCNLYLPEHAPVGADTIYAESLPFNLKDGATVCLKGGINLFHGSAHRTSNHDRRVPGGVMISCNSPGLLAHSLVKRGLAPDLRGAIEAVRSLAFASIGNGGQSRGQRGEHSCSWHNRDDSRPAGQCPMKHRPLHVPDGFATEHYSAMYHTDVLVPSRVMMDSTQDRPRPEQEVWPRLDLAYLSVAEPPTSHENHGFVHGEHVSPEAKFQHQWTPQAAPASPVEECPA
jgi:hypothetical protein